MKLGVQNFQVYLAGRPFQSQRDHHSLVWLDRLKGSNPRLSRWSLFLQPFQYEVVHRSGRANGNADTLSYCNKRVCCRRGKEFGGLMYGYLDYLVCLYLVMVSYLVMYLYPYLLLHVWMYAYGSLLIFLWLPMGRSKKFLDNPKKAWITCFLYIRTDYLFLGCSPFCYIHQ